MAHELEVVEECKRIAGDPLLGAAWVGRMQTAENAAQALYAEIWMECGSLLDEGLDVATFARRPYRDLTNEELERFAEGVARWEWILETGRGGK